MQNSPWKWGSLVLVLALLAVAAAPQQGEQPPRRAVELAGEIVAAEQAELHAPVTGLVQKVHVGLGEHVKAGQLLVELAAPDLELGLEKARALLARAEASVEQFRRAVQVIEAGVERARAQTREAQASLRRNRAVLEHAQAAHARLKRLVETKAVDQAIVDEAAGKLEVSRAAVEEAEAKVMSAESALKEGMARREMALAEVKGAEAGVLAARADARHAEVLLSHTRLRAPFAGVVTERRANVGERVGAAAVGRSAPLLRVARVDHVRVLIHVPEAEAVRLARGAKAVVRVASLKGQRFEGKVTRIGAALNLGDRTLRAEIDLPNPEGRLLPGMSATVTVTLAEPPKKEQTP